MATATFVHSSPDPATTVSITYDTTTLAILSVTAVNGGTVSRTFTATVGTKTWSITMAPGSTQTVNVPKNVAANLILTQDTTQPQPYPLYMTGYTLTVA